MAASLLLGPMNQDIQAQGYQPPPLQRGQKPAVPHPDPANAPVEEMPTFQGGGIREVHAYLHKHIRFPPFCGRLPQKNEGAVEFTVDETGAATAAHMVKPIDSRVDEAVLATVYAMPHFTPGRQNGFPVKVKLYIPLKFHFQ
jgi:protein TonB